MNGKLIALLTVFAVVPFFSCGEGSSDPTDDGAGSGGSDASSNVSFATSDGTSVTAGAVSIPAHAPFTATFTESMDAVSIDGESFFIVEGTKSSATDSAFDLTTCNSGVQLEAGVECAGDDTTTTSCTLSTRDFLAGETGYTLCINASAAYSDGGAFDGVAVSFTTGTVTANSQTCTDTSVQVHPVVENVSFDIANTRRISRYRSCLGHSMDDEFEPPPYSSMKHYVYGPTGHANCYRAAIYAPFDGTVVGALADDDVSDDTDHVNAGCDESSSSAYVAIRSTNYPRFAVNLEHINPVSGLETGDTVSVGDEIGYAIYPTPENGSWDLIFGTVDISNDLFISESGLSLYSYCTIGGFLSDDAVSTLSDYGVGELSDLWFTKTERETDECGGTMGGNGVPDDQMSFDAAYGDDLNQWVSF